MHSARNLGFIFDEHLCFSNQISTLSHSCYYHICQLCCIRPYLDFKTASTIATSTVHSKLYYNLPKSQITSLQQIQNSLARAVVKAPKFCHITPILHSLHWLKITECIEHKILSLTYKVLTTTQRSYLHHLITVQPHHSTHSSFIVTFSCSPSSSSLWITDQSFRYVSPCLRQPHAGLSILDSNIRTHTSSALSINSLLSSSVTPSLFHSQLKTYLFGKSFPP